MKKTSNAIFHAVFGFLLSLFLLCEANASTKPLISEIYSQRRLFKWTSPELFLDSFVKGVPVEFIGGNLKGTQVTFSTNTTAKEKILIVGGGLAWDDDVAAVKTPIFASETTDYIKRAKYYPFNAYLVDLEGKYYDNGKLNFIESHPDKLVDIRIPIDTKETKVIPSIFKKTFDIVIFEYLYPDALTLDAFKNAYEMLKSNGKLILNCPVYLQAQEEKELQQKKEFIAKTISNLGTIYYLPSNKLPSDFLRFTLFCSKSDYDRLKVNGKKIFEAFKEEANKWIIQAGFTSSELENSTNYWYAKCCSQGYCSVYKKD